MSQQNDALQFGRPRIPSKQDLLDFAFGVPDSPPQFSNKSRKTVQRRVSKQWSKEDVFELDKSPKGAAKGLSSRPFEGAMEDDARHNVCNDSLRPWTYLLTIPGKNVRDMLISAFNQWIHCDAEQLITIKQVVAYLHSASLIVDDIEDESVTRRGFPAAHVQFGVAPSLNAANYVYFLALEKLLTLQSTEAVTVYTNEMCNLHRGQGRDIHWRVTGKIISEEMYLQMVQDKTGGLFRLAIRIMHAVSAESARKSSDGAALAALVSLCNDMAAYFQIRDDLINLASPEFHKKKGFCEDITEGKLSFIALHSMRSLDGSRKADDLLKILASKTTDVPTIKRALQIMHETGSFDHTLEFLNALKTKIDVAIQALGGNKALSEVVNALAKDLDDCRDIEGVINSSAHSEFKD